MTMSYSCCLLPAVLVALYASAISHSNLVGAQRVADDVNLSSSNSQNSTLSQNTQTNTKIECNIKYSKIVGNILSLQHDDLTSLRMTLMNTRILVNYGQFLGYPKEDGSFEIDHLPPDSYVVEIAHPKFVYEAARVDITSKGKIRARRVNYVQPAIVQTLDYPLSFRPKSLHNYFIPRETWRLTDIIFNPMIIMMIIPLLIIWVLPMMSPPEVQTQRDNVQMPEYNVPELSEMMANMFGQRQAQSQAGAGAGNQALTAGSGSSKQGKKRR